MRRRTWLWIGFAAISALALAAGYLIRPMEELEALRSLHPIKTKTVVQGSMTTRIFAFAEPPELVMAKLPLPPGSKPSRYLRPVMGALPPSYRLPSGNSFSFGIYSGYPSDGPGTCYVIVEEFARPWHLRAWCNLKHRLGLG
jgi:hypothetical protein